MGKKIINKILTALYYAAFPIVIIAFVIFIFCEVVFEKSGFRSKIKRKKMIKKLNKEAEEVLKNNENTQEFISKRFESYMSGFNKFRKRQM